MYGRVFVRQGARRPTLLSLTSAYRPWLASIKGMFTNAALGLFVFSSCCPRLGLLYWIIGACLALAYEWLDVE